MALVHLAVMWPFGLGILIEKGVDVNAEDHYGRRPIHGTVALGSVESVEYLIKADCALFTTTNKPSLLQLARNVRDRDKRWDVLDLPVTALINRHTRLLDLAEDLLLGSMFSKFQVRSISKSERSAPDLIELLVSHGICVPETLQLGWKELFP
jgi:hypothetical protein